MKPHKHAELIKAWADGAIIEWLNGKEWVVATPQWRENEQYRIKPVPEKIYPLSQMTQMEINTVFAGHLEQLVSFSEGEAGRRIANAAIKRAIDDGQVLIADDLHTLKQQAAYHVEWIKKSELVQENSDSSLFNTLGINRADVMKREIEELRANRAKRDWAVAMAVRHYIRDFGILHDGELSSIIAGVK